MNALALLLTLTLPIATGPQLSLPGNIEYGDQVPITDQQSCFALIVEAQGARLQRTVVRLTPLEGGVGNPVNVGAPDLGNDPLVFLCDMPLKNGAVAASVFGNGHLAANASLTLSIPDDSATLRMACPKVAKAGCSLLLQRGGKKQVLGNFDAAKGKNGRVTLEPDIGFAVMFAGDLDRDGKIDLLIDTSDSHQLSEPTLFLSSFATKEELVHKVASQGIMDL